MCGHSWTTLFLRLCNYDESPDNIESGDNITLNRNKSLIRRFHTLDATHFNQSKSDTLPLIVRKKNGSRARHCSAADFFFCAFAKPAHPVLLRRHTNKKSFNNYHYFSTHY
jgi:hypothetical protein